MRRHGAAAKKRPCRHTAMRVVAAICLALVTACSTSGRSFDASALSRIEPGKTTLAQAGVLLGAEPQDVYHQDGSVLARWAHKVSVVTDAVYFRRELWLRFGPDGRFERVVESVNVADAAGAGTDPAPGSGARFGSGAQTGVGGIGAAGRDFPQAVPTAFPYDAGIERGTVAYPVKP